MTPFFSSVARTRVRTERSYERDRLAPAGCSRRTSPRVRRTRWRWMPRGASGASARGTAWRRATRRTGTTRPCTARGRATRGARRSARGASREPSPSPPARGTPRWSSPSDGRGTARTRRRRVTRLRRSANAPPAPRRDASTCTRGARTTRTSSARGPGTERPRARRRPASPRFERATSFVRSERAMNAPTTYTTASTVFEDYSI